MFRFHVACKCVLIALGLVGASETVGQTYQPLPPNLGANTEQLFSNANPTPMVFEAERVDPKPPETFPKVKLTGFFQADVGWVSQDALNMATVGDVQDGADFRRARLAAAGDAAENVGYMVEFDFAFPGRPTFMDVWLEVRSTEVLGNVKVGQFRQPIGLDGLTGVKELTFVERSLPFAFLPFRQIGVMSSGSNDPAGTTWAVSGFRFPTDFYGSQVGDNGGYGLATRLTKLLIDGDDVAVHIGGAYSFVDPSNDAVQYRSQPEFFISETGGSPALVGVPSTVPPFVDTGVISTNHANYFAAELAATSGALHTQTEFIQAVVDRQVASGVDFYGVSSQVGYVLTGEHRPYNKKTGTLGRIVPNSDYGKNGLGAFEVAARWSYLDLNDADIAGGQLSNLTFGANWYLNKNTKFQVNYINSELNQAAFGESHADFVVFRAQVDF